MATYAIGDVQGCFEPLMRLVRRIRFDRRRDRLWFVGDLVNRGPQSLEVLRWIRDQGDRAVAVLGNHDLRLLAVADGLREPGPRDTLGEVLDAPDRDDLLAWLRNRPLLHREDPFVLFHAGLLPSWTVAQAEELARGVAHALQGSRAPHLLRALHERPHTHWREDLEPAARLEVALLALTYLRTCTPDGKLCLGHKGPPENATADCLAWFSIPNRRSHDATVVFGHWSALGLVRKPGILALDTGCVWGGPLTAVRLEDRQCFQVEAR